MSPRMVSIVFLFASAIAVSGLTLALALALGARVDLTFGSWITPGVLFVSFVCVFFLARDAVLPRSLASPPLKALIVLSAWMGSTLLATAALTWATRPIMTRLTGGSSTLLMLFVCLLASMLVLDRLSAANRTTDP